MNAALTSVISAAEFQLLRLVSLGLVLEDGQLRILDQRLLPDNEVWIHVENPQHMEILIKRLSVRGAPLIGVAAALSLACYAQTEPGLEKLRQAARLLREARPTAVNLMWAIDRIQRAAPELAGGLVAGQIAAKIASCAVDIFHEDVRMCEGMGDAGAALVNSGDGIMTICNTGGLATVGIGTAFAAIRRAHEQGKNIHVYACETRPLLQGGRLTTWELAKCGIPHTLITDSMAATVMRSGKIQRVFTGADRVSVRGDFANKIGTYNLAVAAKHHQIPFYPVAPWSTVDLSCANAAAIPIEERAGSEVLGVEGAFGSVRWAPAATKVFNPSFDVTPAELMTGVVLDRGYFPIAEFQAKKW